MTSEITAAKASKRATCFYVASRVSTRRCERTERTGRSSEPSTPRARVVQREARVPSVVDGVVAPALARALRGTRRALSSLARAHIPDRPPPRLFPRPPRRAASARRPRCLPQLRGGHRAALGGSVGGASQPSATDATLDLATGTDAFAVADAVEEAKRWAQRAPARCGAPEGSVASVLGLDKDRHALKRANEALLNLRSPKENESFTSRVRVAFAWRTRATRTRRGTKRRSVFARAYCAFGLNHFADPETRRRSRELRARGAFVASVWAPLEKTQPLFYAAYLAVVETID